MGYIIPFPSSRPNTPSQRAGNRSAIQPVSKSSKTKTKLSERSYSFSSKGRNASISTSASLQNQTEKEQFVSMEKGRFIDERV